MRMAVDSQAGSDDNEARAVGGVVAVARPVPPHEARLQASTYRGLGERTVIQMETLRAAARNLGIGRLRDRIRASSRWVAVPARRIKDLDAGGILSSRPIALTFDDGPDSNVTPQLLELLDSHSVRATFFMCGIAARHHPDVVRAVAGAGHSIGGHSWDHRLIRGLSPFEWHRQIDDTHALLEDLSGAPIRWFRPPWGHTDRRTRETLRERGIATVCWSAAGRDWSLRDPELIAESVLNDLDPGTIVLLHDAIADYLTPNPTIKDPPANQEPTVHATDILVRSAREHDLRLVPLDVLHAATLPKTGRPRLVTAS